MWHIPESVWHSSEQTCACAHPNYICRLSSTINICLLKIHKVPESAMIISMNQDWKIYNVVPVDVLWKLIDVHIFIFLIIYLNSVQLVNTLNSIVIILCIHMIFYKNCRHHNYGSVVNFEISLKDIFQWIIEQYNLFWLSVKWYFR